MRDRAGEGPDRRQVRHRLTRVPFCPCSRCYSPHGAYAQSKLALVLCTYHLQRLLAAQGSPVTANVADPGVVDTDLYRHVFWGTRLIQKMLGWWAFKVSLRRSPGGSRPCPPRPRGRPPRGHLRAAGCTRRVNSSQRWEPPACVVKPPPVFVYRADGRIRARVSESKSG